MKVSALIPLRGGSKSIPRKNIRYLAGKPLCAWVLLAAERSELFEEILVSTEDEEIAQVAQSVVPSVRIVWRPRELATDSSSTESAMIHSLGSSDYEILCTLQATSPLTSPDHLKAAWAKFTADELDSMLTAVRVSHFYWSMQGVPLNYCPSKRPRRQDFPGSFAENGAFYFTKRDILVSKGCRLGGKIGIFEMPQHCLAELDEPSDWSKLENLLALNLDSPQDGE